MHDHAQNNNWTSLPRFSMRKTNKIIWKPRNQFIHSTRFLWQCIIVIKRKLKAVTKKL